MAGIDLLESVKKDVLKQELIDSVEMSARRKQYIKEYEDMKSFPDKYNIAPDKYKSPDQVFPDDEDGGGGILWHEMHDGTQ